MGYLIDMHYYMNNAKRQHFNIFLTYSHCIFIFLEFHSHQF